MPTTDIPVGRMPDGTTYTRPVTTCDVEGCSEEGSFGDVERDAYGREVKVHRCHKHWVHGTPVARKK